MSRDSDWYEGLRARNPWLPPADKVLDAEATWPQPSKGPATMDLRVIVDLPPKPEPTWEESLPPLLESESGQLLPNALTSIALAMKSGGDLHRHHLLNAGARVRAMAPPGYSWWLPPVDNIKPERRTGMLQQVVADLVAVATYRDQGMPDRADEWVRTADAVLHGLWLGAR
jgi:hypothetical protein